MTENKQIEYYNHGHKKKFSLKTWGFIGFVLILLVLMFTAFSEDKNVTGKNVVVNGLKINSELSLVPLELNNLFKRIELQGSYNTYLNVGGERFDLSKSSNVIVLENFDGDVSIDGKTVKSLKGDAEKILVNGVQVMPDATSSLSIKMEDFKFRSLEIDDGVYINDLTYNATGTINAEGTVLDLNNELVSLEKFYGSLVIEENSMKLIGDIESISSEGKSKVSISS